MTEQKKIALFILCVFCSIVILRQVLKKMDLSLIDYPKFSPGPNTKTDWINYATPLAKVVGSKYGIPWQAIVVHTALETSWGKSSSFAKYNNWAGIKAVKGDESVDFSTIEYINGKKTTIIDGFRVWKTPYDGLKGYAEFIHNNPRYSQALKHPSNATQYLYEVAVAGFATDPNYFSKLETMLSQNFSA